MGLLYEKKTQAITFGKNSRLMGLPHLHKEIEFVYVIEGRAYATVDNERYEINQGDVFFTFPNQIHHYQNITQSGTQICRLYPLFHFHQYQ